MIIWLCKCHYDDLSESFRVWQKQREMHIWLLLVSQLIHGYYVPILSTNNSAYHHGAINVERAIKTAIEHVKEDFDIELNPKYLMTDCDPAKTINKIAAIYHRGVRSEKQESDRPVAFVGFACDAEYNSFAELSAHDDWRVPIIATGVRTNLAQRRSQLDTTIRVGVTAEAVGELIKQILIHEELSDVRLVSLL